MRTAGHLRMAERMRELANAGTPAEVKVAVVEREILGVRAWHWRCLECGKEGRGQYSEAAAVRQAREHGKRCEGGDRQLARPSEI